MADRPISDEDRRNYTTRVVRELIECSVDKKLLQARIRELEKQVATLTAQLQQATDTNSKVTQWFPFPV